MAITPSDHGIVVDHKGSGTRYAVSDKNYDPRIHRKVRDLKPGETVQGFTPKRRSETPQDALTPQGDPNTQEQADSDLTDLSEPVAETEGAEPAASQDKKGK